METSWDVGTGKLRLRERPSDDISDFLLKNAGGPGVAPCTWGHLMMNNYIDGDPSGTS